MGGLCDAMGDAIRAGEPDSDKPTNAALLRRLAERRANRLRALIPAVLGLYWAAKTPQQERDAYQLMRALGLPPSYGEAE